jgi:hypothetical protein
MIKGGIASSERSDALSEEARRNYCARAMISRSA